MDTRINKILSREIISAGSFPTLETTVILEDGTSGTASVPFGSSAGSHEARTLVDEDPRRFHGLGMLKAQYNVENVIAPMLYGKDALDQQEIDSLMIDADGTDMKVNLGGNSILSISLACARAGSRARGIQLFEYLAELYGGSNDFRFPMPMMVAIEGGKHADQSTDFQEYMISPKAEVEPSERVRLGIEVYQSLRKVLQSKGYAVNVGYEGAYAPTNWTSNEEPLSLIVEAIEKAGYEPGNEIGISLDPAASEFHNVQTNMYSLSRESRTLSSEDMIEYLALLAERYPIISIEDGLAEDDWENWAKLNRSLGSRTLIIGDDLTVTQVKRLQRAIDTKAINAILIKPNQVGSVTETLDTMKLADQAGIKNVVSHRGGGETNDTFIVDLAVAVGAYGFKVGASRGERVEKYNRLMAIASHLSAHR